jgi:hypothetical protein
MDSDDLSLELFRIKAHASMIEGLVLKLHILLGVSSSPSDKGLLQRSLAATLQVLEEAAKSAEQTYLSDPSIQAHEAVRSLYAYEFREMVDKMKSRVNSLGRQIAERQGN